MPNDFRFYLITFLIVFFLLGLFIVLLATLYSKKQQKNKIEKMRMQSEYSEALLNAQIEIQENTLKNISQEIHDNIGQVLTLAKLNLGTMATTEPVIQEKLLITKQLVAKAIVDLRDLSRSFNTDHIAAIGFQAAIEYELGLIQKTAGIATSLSVSGEPFRINPQKELILFRIVQEVFNNAMKHAEAGSIRIALSFQDDKLELCIKDNGKGFQLAETLPGKKGLAGLGLRNIQNRAKLIGAEFDLVSQPGAGTTVSIRLDAQPVDKVS